MRYHSFMPRMSLRILTLLVLLWTAWLSNTVTAAPSGDSIRVFTKEHPLIYEDAWDLWPYAFLNDKGEPVGYNVDLLKMLFNELNIPYVMKLKPTKEALNDLKAGRSDLMMGMDDYFHDEYAKFGKSVVQIFTHSVVHQKGESSIVKNKKDLERHKVIVHEGSFSHNLIKQLGWEKNTIPYSDMREAVQKVHSTSGSQILWNTMSLKWLIHTFQYDNLEINPVDIPHGEYRFMSNNPELLHQLDSAFQVLNASGSLQAIQNKWFYPERSESGIPAWIWEVIIALLVLTLCFIIYYIIYWRYEKRMTQDVRRGNNRLALILNTSNIRMWVYHIASNTITRYDDYGRMLAEGLLPSAFLFDVLPDDVKRIDNALIAIARQKQEKVLLDIQGRGGRDGEGLRYYSVALSVLRRDKNGHPTHIIGTTSDVTDEKLRQQRVKDNMLRYQSIFDTALVDMVDYDEHGVITNMNSKAISAFHQDINNVFKDRITIQQVLGNDDLTLENMDYTYLTQLFKGCDERALNRYLGRDELYYELQLVPIRDEEGHLQAIYGTGRDVTEVARAFRQERKNEIQIQRANDEMRSYIRNIDYVLQNGGVRMADYSPDTHTLVIYSEIGVEQYRLTQTRCLSLTADESKKVAQRVLNVMDNRTHMPVEAAVKTTVRLRDGKALSLFLSFIPNINEEGRAESYFGMCRDISEMKDAEEKLAQETAKAQEVETVKNAFLRNMSYEIRTPLNSVVGFAELFQQEHASEDEAFFINEIGIIPSTCWHLSTTSSCSHVWMPA